MCRGVVPKKLRPKYNKLIDDLWDNKEDLEDALEDVKDASKAGLNPSDVRINALRTMFACQHDVYACGPVHDAGHLSTGGAK